MTRIGFLGLGNMGAPMALNAAKAGHQVLGFDPTEPARARFDSAGGTPVPSLAEAVADAEIVISMLPEGSHVEAAYLASGGVLELSPTGCLLIDSSTIDVATARKVEAAAAASGRQMADAPVSGGVGGAEAGSLTFMVGGSSEAFARAVPILEVMGGTIVHAGGPGTGQAAKICNNMILGVSMIAVCEAFALAERLGLEAEKLFAISAKSSGQCWSLTSYCPVPGPVPASPANRDYAPGFTVAMMLKDLRLAQQAAASSRAVTPLGAEACQLYALFAQNAATLDFSAIVKMFRGENA